MAVSRGSRSALVLAVVLALGLVVVGAPASAAGDPATVPGAARLVFAKAGDGVIDVRWQPPLDDGGSPVTRYEVQIKVGGVETGSPVDTGTSRTLHLDGLTNGQHYTFLVRATNAVGTGPWSLESLEYTPVPPGLTFVPVTPCRLYDTRAGGQPLQPGQPTRIRVTEGGACHIPESARSIEATITAVDPDGNGFLRAYPQGFSAPNATFLNYARGEDASNTGTIEVTPSPAPTTGLVLRTYAAATDVVVDVQGYFSQPQTVPAGGLFVAATPCRTYDSRTMGARTPFAAGEQRDLTLVGRPGCNVPANAIAVEATVTAVDSPAKGFVRAFPAGRSAPNATFLTHVGGRSTSNTGTMMIRSGAGRSNLSIRNYASASHVVVDVQGWFVPAPAPPAAVFRSRMPCRIFDTRTAGGPLASGASRSVQITGIDRCNVPPEAVAIEATITAVDPTAAGYARAWPSGGSLPNATILTYAKDRSTTNTGTVKIRPGAAPNLEIRNVGGRADYVIEIQGWYLPTS